MLSTYVIIIFPGEPLVMISHLRILNFALLEEIEIEFGRGLTFFTGETGTGKSILIDAICRILGARSSQDDVRAGESRCMLEAIFEAAALSGQGSDLLREWQIDSEEDALIIRREIYSSGKSRATINNCSVTLQQLRRLAPLLMDVFGQHEHQSLLDTNSQQALYDSSIGILPQLQHLAAISGELHEYQRQWKELQGREQERRRAIDLLQYEIREIEQAAVTQTEEQQLLEKRAILQNSERIMTLCDSLLQTALEGEPNLHGMLDAVFRNLTELQKYRESFAQHSSSVDTWKEDLNEIVRNVDALRRSLDFEETTLDELESRLDLMQRLKKKYGATIRDVLSHLARCKEELDKHLHAEEREESLLKQLDHAKDRYEKLAEEISLARKSEVKEFAGKVEHELKQVAMENCGFRVLLTEEMRDDVETTRMRFPQHGWESVSFEIEPNPGEGFRELDRIASGGELSRLMLALKIVTQRNRDTNSFIFDEIDAGIGGRAAYQIGERLRQLSRISQVLCVTHLPQVAAFADHHFRVVKRLKEDRTITIVEELPDQQRDRELARMLSGSEITETALQHARELRQQVEAVAR